MKKFRFLRIFIYLCFYGAIAASSSAQDRQIMVVEHHDFPTAVREKMVDFNKAYSNLQPVLTTDQMACPKTQRYVEGVLERIIDGSSPTLRAVLRRADFAITITVACSVPSLPDAEMKAGLLEVSAELILLFSSDDEVAAVLAHELAHYTLSHDHKVLEIFSKLSRNALKHLRIQQEEEADAESLPLLANAGYDPYAAVDALIAMRSYFNANHVQADENHPNISARIHTLQTRFYGQSFTQVVRHQEGLEAVQDELRLPREQRMQTASE
jgi:predicted Zn-dependent protease